MSTASTPNRVVIVGGGVTGLACAHRLLTLDPTVDLTILEANERVGGLIHTSPFAGHAAVDEAADAFLLRVPAARMMPRGRAAFSAMPDMPCRRASSPQTSSGRMPASTQTTMR